MLDIHSLPISFRPFVRCGRFFKKTFFLLACATLFFHFKTRANHIIGGEITYEFIGKSGPNENQYIFTLTVFRDCDGGGADLDNPASVGIFEGSISDATLIFDTDVPADIEYVDPVIPACADVNQIPPSCVQRGIYVFTHNLTILPDRSYFIVYQRCCRTSQILNLQNPLDFGSTYMIEITPEAQALGNSSPVFKNYPPGFICNNFKLEFDHSALDVDGDSLVYELCTPLHGGGRNGSGGGCDVPKPSPPCGPPFEPVVFSGNFSFSEPMNGNPAPVIDTFSGLLHGRPFGNGQYVVGICVKEYRNGVLLSMVSRDFQFNVVDCVPAVVADVKEDKLLGPKQFMLNSCGNKTVTILNQSSQNTSQLTQHWTFDLENGSLYEADSWHVTVPFPEYGQYHGILYLNTGFECADTGYLTVNVFPPIYADFEFDYDSCLVGPVEFTDLSVAEAPAGIRNWEWSYGAGIVFDSLQHPDFQFPASGNFAVKLKVTDFNNCSDTENKVVQWFPIPMPEIPPGGPWRVCDPNPVTFEVLDSLNLTGIRVDWDFGDGKRSDEQTPTHVYPGIGTYTLSVMLRNEYDCFATDTFKNAITVHPVPKADFEYAPAEVSNLENTVKFTDKSDSVAVWIWDFGTGDGSYHPNPTYVFQDTGLIPVKLKVINAFGCEDSLTRILDIVPKVKLFIPNVFAPESTTGLGNEKFGVLGILPGYKDYQMRIWSRWGELLFETNDPQEGWDGRRAGNKKRLPTGSYVFEIYLTGPRGEKYVWEGSVLLVE